MRKEIIRARACEKEAIDNNKTVIATLSHDIKAPISSIRAYAEGLDASLDSGPEKRRKYISVIINKCDEVTKLTNDLFLHSISDFEQVIENIISNSVKYAPKSEIIIKFKNYGDKICINIEDYGGGISDEDMPFIFDKFYRGKNVGDNQGSGLGLYIVRYIMTQMGGDVEVINSKEVLDLLTDLSLEGQTILLVTHDLKAALRADRILYIKDGRITGELSLPPYKADDAKSRETQINAWLSSMDW